MLSREEIIISIIASSFDHPSVFMGGPSQRSKRKAESLLHALGEYGFRIEGEYKGPVVSISPTPKTVAI